MRRKVQIANVCYKNSTVHIFLHRVAQSLGSCADIRSEALVMRMFVANGEEHT